MSGKYKQYFGPVLPPSKEKAIVGDTMSMAGGVAAVFLQIAEPSMGASIAAHSSFTVRPIERGKSFPHRPATLNRSYHILLSRRIWGNRLR